MHQLILIMKSSFMTKMFLLIKYKNFLFIIFYFFMIMKNIPKISFSLKILLQKRRHYFLGKKANIFHIFCKVKTDFHEAK